MIKGINHITLAVADLDVSFKFYREILGLVPQFKSKSTAYFKNGNLWLALSKSSSRLQTNPSDYTHFAFDVSSDHFDELACRIVKSGSKIFKENSSEGLSLYFLDPDGHKLEIHIGDLNSRLCKYKAMNSGDHEFFETSFIRSAAEADIGNLTELALRSKAFWGYSQEFIEACRPHLEITAEYIRSWPVKVLEHHGKLLGFYSLKVITGEQRLDNLWIEPNEKKKGYGRLLFKNALIEAKNLHWDHFKMAVEPESVAFYNKMGAVMIGSVKSRLNDDLFLPHMEMRIFE